VVVEPLDTRKHQQEEDEDELDQLEQRETVVAKCLVRFKCFLDNAEFVEICKEQ